MAAERVLILLRHAKSDWSVGGDDHDRPLNKRGQRAAALIGFYLRQSGRAVDAAAASTATRARDTAALVLAQCAERVAPALTRRLYLAAPAAALQVAAGLPPDARCALMVGHNPGLHELARALAAGDGAALAALEEFPTTALAAFCVDGAWTQIAPARARLVDFATPKMLV